MTLATMPLEETMVAAPAPRPAPAMQAPPAERAAAPQAARLDELAEVIRAYNQVTENLRASHEDLRQQVARLQEQLASADAQLQRSQRLAALGQMAAGIAHEIRNPLGAIQLYAGMLLEDLSGLQEASRHGGHSRHAGKAAQAPAEAPAAQAAVGPAAVAEHGGVPCGPASTLIVCTETARKIAGAVRGLNGIVTDVLTFARELSPRCQHLPAAEAFQRVLEAQQPALDGGGVTVRCDCVPADLAVNADADLLHQALLNLVRNAVEAMAADRGRRRRVLNLTAAADADVPALVVLSVRDTGPGIDAAALPRIFNPFFTTRSTGTGLGLAIVHRIVDAHGGTISVRNDHGAVFEVRLPRSSAPDA